MSATEVMGWATPKWSPNVILPEPWVREDGPPEDRGPFCIIHCGDRETALHVRELLNEEVEARIRRDYPRD